MTEDLTQTSKFLSRVLRHRPESIGLSLDENGWASIDALLRLTAGYEDARRLSREIIEALTGEDSAGRFELSADGERLRAVHGHSVEVDLEMAPAAPPETLYHGTVARFLDAILAEGLKPKGRRFVHLSETIAAAEIVGARRGPPVILTVEAGALHRQGQTFHRSSSGVWLTATVPPARLSRHVDAR